MSFAAPLSVLLAVVIPCWIAAQGVALRRIAIGTALAGIAGLGLFLTNPPQDALSSGMGQQGTTGVLLMVAALIAGITLAILGIIQQMSGKTKR
jgi:hypothetical protein